MARKKFIDTKGIEIAKHTQEILAKEDVVHTRSKHIAKKEEIVVKMLKEIDSLKSESSKDKVVIEEHEKMKQQFEKHFEKEVSSMNEKEAQLEKTLREIQMKARQVKNDEDIKTCQITKSKEEKMLGFLERSIADKKQELECPTCLEVAPPPLYMCQDSHLICSTCRPRLDRCPLCRVKLAGTARRHRFAEKMYQDLEELRSQREMFIGA